VQDRTRRHARREARTALEGSAPRVQAAGERVG
jgi:hypothetical protein